MNEEIEQSNLFIELNSEVKSKLVKISPVGDAIGLDKRVFTIDGNSVLQNTKNRMLDIVLNKNHWDSEAYGWFDLNSLELKDDGIYAKLELNNLGDETVKNRHYRYLSPEYMVNANREVVSIVGVGLVNHPNLLNKAINKQELRAKEYSEREKEKKNMDKEQELQKELNTANSKVLTLERNITTLESEKESLQKEINSLKETNKTAKIDNAISAGELLPAQKDFALSLDVNSIDGYLASVKESNLQITKGLKDGVDVKEKNQEQEDKEVNKTLESMGW